MPTMTNPETGETKTLSREEFLAAMKDGRLSVRQEVHHADGTVTASTIYGNDTGDGVDRSVNIFGTMQAIISPVLQKARQIKDADPNAEKLFYMDNTGADYEVTIDDTDLPTMHIVTCTKESVKVSRYIRDEKKSVGKPITEDTFSFTDGKLEATLEDIQKNKLLLYAFAVYELRSQFDQRGILQELKALGNRGSGVIVTISDEELNTQVVCGKNRPDLPCMLFGGLFAESLDEAVMMRPYMDEVMQENLRQEMTPEEKVEAAEDGDTELMEELAMYYLNGDYFAEVEPDPEKAFYWFGKLAQAGDTTGMFNLGLHYAKGHGTQRDFRQAAYWMEKAAEAGDEDAPVLAEKYRKAVAALEKIPSGDAQAQADLAGILMALAGSLNQAGPGKDYEEAFDLAQKSAAQNNGDGIWTLALAYEHGRGVRRAVPKAIEYYRKGADLGHAACQHSLACYYMQGEKVQKDLNLAFELIMKSAQQGYGLAMKDAGRCYQFGHGVQDDMDKAIEWYEKSLAVLPDPELEQKVAMFKMLQSQQKDTEAGEANLPEGYQEALQNFIEEEEARESTNLAEAVRYMGAEFNPDKEELSWEEEVVGTQFEGRNQRIERVRVGDKLELVREPHNKENGMNISVRNRNGESLGNLSVTTCRQIAPIMDENLVKGITARVSEVVPVSKRGARAKKSILKVTITLDLQGMIPCTLCTLSGDQVNIWIQQLSVAYCTMPLKHAQLLFELYNRNAGEYSKLDKGENDTSYAGLDNLEEEIRAAREQMQQQRVAGLDYGENSINGYESFGDYVLRMIGEDPRRYGALRRYEINDYDNLQGILQRYVISEKKYYWVDQTRTDEDEFNSYNSFNHWYEVMELYEGKNLPVDLKDEDVVSIFGCGKFAAFADLSYGC